MQFLALECRPLLRVINMVSPPPEKEGLTHCVAGSAGAGGGGQEGRRVGPGSSENIKCL